MPITLCLCVNAFDVTLFAYNAKQVNSNDFFVTKT